MDALEIVLKINEMLRFSMDETSVKDGKGGSGACFPGNSELTSCFTKYLAMEIFFYDSMIDLKKQFSEIKGEILEVLTEILESTQYILGPKGV